MRGGGTWFVVPSGDHAGMVHMAGWMHTAISLVETGWETAREGAHDGYVWKSLAHCPRCYALVLADDKDVYGDLTWAHEQWHAATDWPIPDEVIEEQRRVERRLKREALSASPDSRA